MGILEMCMLATVTGEENTAGRWIEIQGGIVKNIILNDGMPVRDNYSYIEQTEENSSIDIGDAI